MRWTSGSSLMASLGRLPSLIHSSLSERMRFLQIDPSREDEIMFVIYVCMSRYEIRAFNKSGKKIHKLCFTMDTISLPFYSGFGVLGSTLYMIGGETMSNGRTQKVPSLNTYKINLHTIPRFRNNSLPPDDTGVPWYVKSGPCLNAEKHFPTVIVVGSRIYAFSRFFSPAILLQNFEYLDTDTTPGVAQEWIVLPEPPLEENSDMERDNYAEIVSHVLDKEQSGIIVFIKYEPCSQVCRLDLQTHEWSALSSGVPPSFYGKAVSLSEVNYALKNSPVYLYDRVCRFHDIKTDHRVEEVGDLKTTPAVVARHRQSEMGVIGDTLFLARVGYTHLRDRDKSDQDYHLTVDKFQICKKAGPIKATEFSRKTFKLENAGFQFDWRTVYCVSWVRRSATTRATD